MTFEVSKNWKPDKSPTGKELKRTATVTLPDFCDLPNKDEKIEDVAERLGKLTAALQGNSEHLLRLAVFGLVAKARYRANRALTPVSPAALKAFTDALNGMLKSFQDAKMSEDQIPVAAIRAGLIRGNDDFAAIDQPIDAAISVDCTDLVDLLTRDDRTKEETEAEG